MAARATEEQKAALLAAYDCFVFDLDGTLWKGDVVIDGALDVVKHLQVRHTAPSAIKHVYDQNQCGPWLTWLTPSHGLQALGKDVIYVTNNSTKSRAACAKKLRALGFPVQVRRQPCNAARNCRSLERLLAASRWELSV